MLDIPNDPIKYLTIISKKKGIQFVESKSDIITDEESIAY